MLRSRRLEVQRAKIVAGRKRLGVMARSLVYELEHSGDQAAVSALVRMLEEQDELVTCLTESYHETIAEMAVDGDEDDEA